MTKPVEDPGKDTRLMEFRGRQIVVRQLNEAQILLLAEKARLVTKVDVDAGIRMDAASTAMRILKAAVVQPADREYLEELTIAGDLDIGDLLAVVTIFAQEQKPRTRRGAARR